MKYLIGTFIEIKSKKFNINIPLQRRITYLRGDSGVGKTSLVELIRAKIEDGDDSIELNKPDEYNIDILSSLSSSLDIENKRNSILIADDNINTEGIDFSNAVCNCLIKNDLYLLIINRVDLQFDTNARKKFDYAVNSILWVEKNNDGINHNVFPLSQKYIFDYSNVDYILGEDKYGITQFCMNYNDSDVVIDNTVPKSKDNILNILQTIDCKKYKNVLLFVDLSSFGKYFGDLILLSESTNNNIIFDCNYECFEYMILMSNIFKNIFEPDADINNYFSWEKYFEHTLEKLSKNLLFSKYKHGKSCTKCLLSDCDSCTDYVHCDKIISGNKLDILFRDTDFEYLINILKGYNYA